LDCHLSVERAGLSLFIILVERAGLSLFILFICCRSSEQGCPCSSLFISFCRSSEQGCPCSSVHLFGLDCHLSVERAGLSLFIFLFIAM
jgi:hypothetical protein